MMKKQIQKILIIFTFIIPIALSGTPIKEIENQILELLSKGKQKEAENFLDEKMDKHLGNDRLFFMYICLKRSRFLIQEVSELGKVFLQHAAEGDEKICVQYILDLDQSKNIEKNKEAFIKFADDKGFFIRWMLAVQCRNHNWNELGATIYSKLLENMDPGPVLFHQTYANILDALKRHHDAIKHRRIAVELEPAFWSYDGLALTLMHSDSSPNEVFNAYSKALETANPGSYIDPHAPVFMDYFFRKGSDDIGLRLALIMHNRHPQSASYTAWVGFFEHRLGDFSEAIRHYEKALKLDPKQRTANLNLAKAKAQLQQMKATNKTDDN